MLLEGVRHPAPAVPDERGTLVVQQLLRLEQLGQQRVEALQLGEHDVTAEIPGEAYRRRPRSPGPRPSARPPAASSRGDRGAGVRARMPARKALPPGSPPGPRDVLGLCCSSRHPPHRTTAAAADNCEVPPPTSVGTGRPGRSGLPGRNGRRLMWPSGATGTSGVCRRPRLSRSARSRGVRRSPGHVGLGGPARRSSPRRFPEQQ